ncbi:MAG: hypothetical protein LBR52_04800 [Prevotellaceae bacterium]|jgi:hypothetical protein|nr:hypothetical protein [Prevotellaceae bacterium]
MNTIKYISLIITFCLISSYVQAEVIPAQEFEGLRIFYRSLTNTDKDNLLTRWDTLRTDNDVSGWRGITVENGHITAIDVSGIGLEADYSQYNRDCFVYFTKLKTLNLSNNYFKGSFPFLTFGQGSTHISAMTDLEYLIIDNNEFTDCLGIPDECDKLKIINAENNKFSCFYGNGNFIEEINLRNNNIFHQNFMPVYFYKEDSIEITLRNIDVRGNKLNFGNLWMFANPQTIECTRYVLDEETGYYHTESFWDCVEDIYRNPQIEILLSPQDSVEMTASVPNKKIRTSVGRSVFVQVPDVGHHNDGLWSSYPEIIDSLSFQWYRNDIALEADTFPDLTINSITGEDFGRYYCEIRSKATLLQELVLYTQSIEISDEENLPPVLTISNSVQQPQRIKKGTTSLPVQLQITDDLPLTAGSSAFISQPLNHLEFLGSLSSVQVRDTSTTFLGKDSLQITYCDYEGACDSIRLYYIVYDDLLPPPFDSIQAIPNGSMIIQCDTAFYNTYLEKPENYYVLVMTNPSPVGNGNYTQIDSVAVTSSENRLIINIPENTQEYALQLRLYAQNSNQSSAYPSIINIPMPAIPDSDLAVSGDSTGVTLSWTLTSSATSYMLTNHNVIYRSVDGGEFIPINSFTGFNQTSFVDYAVESGHRYSYKLVKKALALGSSIQIELPYLESNIAEIFVGELSGTLLNTTFAVAGQKQSTTHNQCNMVIVPNPMPSYGSNVSFTLNSQSTVTGKVYTTQGVLVQTFFGPLTMGAGPHSMYLQPTNLTSGRSYIITIETNVGVCAGTFMMQ